MHQLVLTLLAVLSSGLFVADIDLASDRARKATARGWVALAGALPSLPALATLWMEGNTGLGSGPASDGVQAVVAAVLDCPRLRNVWVGGCELSGTDQAKLRGDGWVLNRGGWHKPA